MILSNLIIVSYVLFIIITTCGILIEGLRRKLLMIGCIGILVTALASGSIRIIKKITTAVRNESGLDVMTRHALNGAVREIEFFNLSYGKYPDKLEQLVRLPGAPQAMLVEPIQLFRNRNDIRQFQYKVINGGAKYELFSVGLDGIAYTNDDIFPDIYYGPSSRIGHTRNRERGSAGSR